MDVGRETLSLAAASAMIRTFRFPGKTLWNLPLPIGCFIFTYTTIGVDLSPRLGGTPVASPGVRGWEAKLRGSGGRKLSLIHI